MTNVETKRLNNLSDLAELLRSLPDNDDATADRGFDMNKTSFDAETDHPCGSAACIGGWVQACNPELIGLSLEESVARLGATFSEARKLCWANTPEGKDCTEAWSATPKQAARAVEILRDTGLCNWPRALEEES